MIQISGKLGRFRPQSSGRRKLPFPAAPNLRIAQVTVAGTPFDLVQTFPPERWDELENFRPGVLVGDAADLQLLAERAAGGTRRHSHVQGLDLSSVDHAIFVLMECGCTPATDVLRVVLWQAFGVPVYELLISAGGRVLAAECEAHEGWHVESDARFTIRNDELVLDASGRNPLGTGLRGIIETEACPCGRANPRLMNVEQLHTRGNPREFAATA